jgi:Protein of unknown function (DUF2510)
VHVSSGWYRDPLQPGTERYWDGTDWTEARRPCVVELPEWTDLPEQLAGAGVPSTVGFELPSYETLARMGATPVAPVPEGPPHGAGARAGGSGATDRSGPAGSRLDGSRRWVRKALSVVLGGAVVATVSFVVVGRRSDANAAVVAAVNAALSDRTADVAITGSGSTAGSSFSITGTGAIDFTQRAMQVSLDVNDGTQQLNEEVVYQNKVIYVNVGNAIDQIVPGKSWVSLTLSQLSSAGGMSSFGSGNTLGNDPAAALQSLRQEGNGATDLGSSTVDGMNVEGYSVQLTNPAVGYRVYVDSAGQLVRLTTAVNETRADQGLSETATMDFSHYGASVSVTPPPAGEVAPFQTFLKAAMALTASSGSLD